MIDTVNDYSHPKPFNILQVNKFVDLRNVRTLGGNGGDGAISFLSLWANENAGRIAITN